MYTTIRELMTKHPVLIPPHTTLEQAAREMKAIDCGVLPVGDARKLEGIITDRDIVVRAVAGGIDTSEAWVSDYMTPEVFYCNEEDSINEALRQMREHDVNRLVVRNEDGIVTGVITFGCIMRNSEGLKEVCDIAARNAA